METTPEIVLYIQNHWGEVFCVFVVAAVVWNFIDELIYAAFFKDRE